MKGGTIVSRVVGATVVVSLSSAIILASVATLTARVLWRDHLLHALDETATSLLRSIEHEAADSGGISLEQAAPDALVESAAAGYSIEIWKGPTLIARNTSGQPLGPRPLENAPRVLGPWLVTTRSLGEGLAVTVAIPKERGLRPAELFRQSLLYSLPVCLLLSTLIGWFVGGRAVRPLRDFTEEIARIRALRAPQLSPIEKAPAEVRDLERSFGALLTRLQESHSRELEFAANASHELRTPLTRIRLRAERALTDAGPGAALEIGALIGEIDKLVRLVDALLVLARDVESGIPAGEGVNLADLVRERAEQVFGDEHPVHVEAPDETMVRGDEDLLSIAVENLMDNAKKYTPPGREPRVVVTEDEAAIRVELFSPDVQLPADVERLFLRFARGDESWISHEGHGLGLPLARHIAELHKGRLFCREGSGRERKGAFFVFELPRWEPETPGPASTEPPTSDRGQRTPRGVDAKTSRS